MDRATILNSDWYTISRPRGGIICIGVVAILISTDKWKCYMEVGYGVDQSIDEQLIARHGAKVPKKIACAYFPELDSEKYIS